MPIIISSYYSISTPQEITVYRQVSRSTTPFVYWRLGIDSGTTVPDEVDTSVGTITNSTGLGAEGAVVDTDTAMTFYGDAGAGSPNMGDARVQSALFNQIKPNTTNMSIAGWSKTTVGGSPGPVMSEFNVRRNSSNITEALVIARNVFVSGEINFRHNGSNLLSNTVDLDDGQYHFICGTLEGTSRKLYIDGELDNSDTVTRSTDTSDVYLYVGANLGTLQFFDGDIDEVKLFRRTLTPTDVKRMYLVGTGSEDNYKTLSLAQSPTAYWRLGESSGTTAQEIANGGSPGFHGTYINTPTLGVTGPLANDSDTAVTFAGGSSEYVDTTYPGILGTNDRSVVFWLKTTDATQPGIVNWGTNGSNGGKWDITINDDGADGNIGAVRLSVQGGFKTATKVVNDDEWHHVAVTFSGSNVTDADIYVDGVHDGSTDSSSQAINTITLTNVRMGRRLAAANYYTGSLDEVKIYPRELNADEVADDYALGKHGPNTYAYINHKLNPVTYWRLGESSIGSPALAADETGNEYDGVYTNTPTLNQTGAIVNDSNPAVLFTATNSEYISTSYAGILGANPRTVSFWIKTTDTSDQGLVSWGNYASAGEKWQVRINDNSGDGTVGAIRTEVNGGFVIGSINVADGNWHHIASAFAGTNITDMFLYVDGVRDTPSGNSGQIVNTTGGVDNVEIARRRTGVSTWTYFTGTLDEVSIFDRGLIRDEIKMIYDKGKDLF